jgi:hypothetical protein
MVVIPRSMDASRANRASFSSAPPHIHPPIAHAPNEIDETLIPVFGNSVYVIVNIQVIRFKVLPKGCLWQRFTVRNITLVSDFLVQYL